MSLADKTDLRDIDKLNNPMTPAELAAYAPGIDWAAYLADAKVNAAEADRRRQYRDQGDRGIVSTGRRSRR